MIKFCLRATLFFRSCCCCCCFVQLTCKHFWTSCSLILNAPRGCAAAGTDEALTFSRLCAAFKWARLRDWSVPRVTHGMHVNCCNLWNSPPAYHAPPPLPLSLSPLSLSLFRCTANGFYRCISVCCVFRTLFSSWQVATGWVTSSIPHPANHAPTSHLPAGTCWQLFLLVFMSLHVFPSALSPASVRWHWATRVSLAKNCAQLSSGVSFSSERPVCLPQRVWVGV